jgi:G:T/U-mismatch repair DNA glycosylase
MSLTSDRSQSHTGQHFDRWEYELPRSPGTRVGVSFSGGGIRSATFCLGVYQRLSEAGMFQRARFLSAVSGGGYLAAGLAVSHACAPDSPGPGAPPWGRGSSEESRLRQNLSYLAPGSAGRLWLCANLFYGLILNLTPLVLSAFVLGHLTGMLYRVAYPGLGTAKLDAGFASVVAIAACGALVSTVFVVGSRRFRDKQKSRVGRSAQPHSENVSTFLIEFTALVLLLFAVLPVVVHHLARAKSSDFTTFLQLDGLHGGIQRFLLGVAGVACALVMGAVAVWLLQRRRLPLLRGVLAAVAGAAVLLVPFVLAAETGSARDFTRQDAISLLAACVVILLFGVFAHNRRYSMHLFYRERIQEAFTSSRPYPDDRRSTARSTAHRIPYSERILLTDVAAVNAERAAAGGPQFPELVVCAAVAARGEEVPNKAWAASFTFEGECAGNPRLGLDADTRELEHGDWIGGGGLTLPSMMAISGAALSPMMGRFTLPAFRFLMAVMNIRLGVWVRNPSVYIDAGLPSRKRPVRWLVRYVVRGWREPGAWYVLKEGLGLAGTKGRYIYVSDGGHWENLGLTELFRRRCTHIIAVDASGSATLGDIGRAMSVARAELGVEVDLDPRGAVADANGLASSPVVVGNFKYPDGQLGAIYFARSVLWDGAPVDLRLFAEHEKAFPNHPTANQFLSGEVFDAYRALGWAVGGELESKVHLPPPAFDEPRRSEKVLAPILCPGLTILFANSHPSMRSAELGHHFARPGSRFYATLYAAGFTDRPLRASEDLQLLEYRVGITNLVAEAMRPPRHPSPAELITGVADLEATVEHIQPRVVAILGRRTYRIAFDKPHATWGLQDHKIGGRPVWVLPDPTDVDERREPSRVERLYTDAREYADLERLDSRFAPQPAVEERADVDATTAGET